MKCVPRAPQLVTRNAAAIAEELSAHRRGYTPEWRKQRGEGDAGMALNEIFARFLEIQGDGLNAMPQRLQLEFLESLGANVLPPQPARAPLVFKLLETASDNATVPVGTRVAAVLPPPAPSLESDAAPKRMLPPEFVTEQEITAMRGNLAAVYSIDPQADTYADHTADVARGFTIFGSQQPVPHRLYLAHAELFKLSGSAEIVLSFDFATPRSLSATRSRRPLLLEWEYLSADGWQPLVLIEDLTERFTVDGRITLAKIFGPDSLETVISNHSSYWIRATVSHRTPSARIATEASGYLIRFAPISMPSVQVGDVVELAGDAGRTSVLAAYHNHIIVDARLQAAAPGKMLRAVGGMDLGFIVAAPAEFRLPVEDTREFLVGDVVTIDGAQRARVVTLDGSAVYLSNPLDEGRPGVTLELADALPPLRPDGADDQGALPQLDLIRARVGFGKTDLTVDSAYLGTSSIDLSNTFYPFGEQPNRFAVLYLACKDAFTRNGARVQLQFVFDQTGRDDTSAKVVAEVFDGSRWVGLGPKDEYTDTSNSMTRPKLDDAEFPHATLAFTVPADWAESELNGDKARWLRLRLVEGDYGHPLAISVEFDPADNTKYIVKSTPSTLQPPIIAGLTVSYLYFTNPQSPDFCLTENDFAFAEHSEDARWPRSPFAPFVPVSDLTPALHFGFSSKPPTALVSLLAHVLLPALEGDPQPYVWDYWGSRGWTQLSVGDTTAGFNQTGLIQFIGAPDAVLRDGLGSSLYRVRARLKSGLVSRDQIVQCGGVWLNAVWARQGKYVERDGLGTSSGNPDQTFALPVVRSSKAMPASDGNVVAASTIDFTRALDMPIVGVPILGNEKVEVREWTGRGDDWQTVLGQIDPADVRFEVDPQDPTIKTAAWVLWKARPHFFRSGPHDRHYVVERAGGVFRFPGIDGFIPPAGAPIVASYVTGGGTEGNVPAGAVRELRSGVGFVQSVANPLAATGGAATEMLRATRDRSAQSIRNRGRAVSFEDYEWMAMSASSEVARVRALPLDGPAGRGRRGCVAILVVPQSLDAQPIPSPELCSAVINEITRRTPAGIADGIRVITPRYVPVGVRAEVLPRHLEEAGRVEAHIRSRVTRFLHPLVGGRDGHGWEFGESVYPSDLEALIEDTPGVDAVRFLCLMVGQSVYADKVPIEPQQLITSGDSQLKIIVPSVPYALA